jgi:hypothetical protein
MRTKRSSNRLARNYRAERGETTALAPAAVADDDIDRGDTGDATALLPPPLAGDDDDDALAAAVVVDGVYAFDDADATSASNVRRWKSRSKRSLPRSSSRAPCGSPTLCARRRCLSPNVASIQSDTESRRALMSTTCVEQRPSDLSCRAAALASATRAANSTPIRLSPNRPPTNHQKNQRLLPNQERRSKKKTQRLVTGFVRHAAEHERRCDHALRWRLDLSPKWSSRSSSSDREKTKRRRESKRTSVETPSSSSS